MTNFSNDMETYIRRIYRNYVKTPPYNDNDFTFLSEDEFVESVHKCKYPYTNVECKIIKNQYDKPWGKDNVYVVPKENIEMYRRYKAYKCYSIPYWKTYEDFENWSYENGWKNHTKDEKIWLWRKDSRFKVSPANCKWVFAKDISEINSSNVQRSQKPRKPLSNEKRFENRMKSRYARIKNDSEFDSFEHFMKWSIKNGVKKYNPAYLIRKNKELKYSPSNCYYSSNTEDAKLNKIESRLKTYDSVKYSPIYIDLFLPVNEFCKVNNLIQEKKIKFDSQYYKNWKRKKLAENPNYFSKEEIEKRRNARKQRRTAK